jgi:aminopeptidase-like protein
MSYDDFIKLEDDEYEVFIDSSLKPGTLEIAEVILPGQSEEEIFFSTYCCHPSMANNELSGPIIAAMIYKTLSEAKNRRYTYRFYFGPETIGSLAYLKIRGNELKKNMKAGMILTCCGNSGGFTYKKLKKTGILDNAVEHVLKFIGKPYELIDFFPTGSDDRQYCSPGFNLPVGTLCRSMYGKYEYYHTSKDDLNFVTKSSMLESLDVFLKIIYVLEKDLKYKNLKPFGEPFFSKYGLQSSTGAARKGSDHVRKIKYILSFSDGFHSIMDIADKMGIPIWELETAINDLMKAELLCAE